ncbi:EAL domain-containing protein [Thalassospira sp. MA62]|nr:EAL domain-containing protein [Thalassospira sp. MA62]
MTDTTGYAAEINDQELLAAMAFCWADMLLEVDENGYVLFVAGATESLLGCPPDRLIGEALETLVIKSERPLLRAYLHAGPGMRRLEELDLDFQLIEPDGVTHQDPVPLSLSGYIIADPSCRYYIAARHRAIRPRARSGIDRLILQNAVLRQQQKTLATSGEPHQTAESAGKTYHSEALVVLENLAAARSEAETAATTELARLIGIGHKTSLRPVIPADLDQQSSHMNTSQPKADDTMIELERRIVAYASALRADLETPADRSPADATPDSLSALTNGPVESKKAHPSSNQHDLFGADYDSARKIHQFDGDNDRETNLTRAVAYALNRMQRKSQQDVSAERLSASLPHLIHETLKSVRAFREIVENGSFAVALQPIVHLSSKDMHHYEALARFTTTSSPLAVDQIIHFAEGTGLITEFDLAMTAKVLDHLRDQPHKIPYPVAINLSGHSLEQPDFLPSLARLLDTYNLAPERVLFEVTETSRIRGLADVNTGLQMLRTRGHQVCLDDFGAGAANFEYLSALDVDIIKFDGGAMRTALANTKGRAFIKATALLCRDLGIQTIAEMIHDQASYEMVRDLGIDYGQGYHLGPPATIGNLGAETEPNASRFARDKNPDDCNSTDTPHISGGSA